MDSNTVGPGERRNGSSQSRTTREEVRTTLPESQAQPEGGREYRAEHVYREHRDERDLERERERGARRDEYSEREREALGVAAGGSSFETICAGGALVLAILGLVGVIPFYMLTIGTIAFGAALMAKGAAFMATATRSPSLQGEKKEVAGGSSVEFLGGAAGVVLGILALIGMSPLTLVGISVIVFGGSVLFGGGASAEAVRHIDERGGYARRGTEAGFGMEALIGIGAVVLGILALLGTNPATLLFISLIGLGGSALFAGGALTSRVASAMRRY